MGVLISLMVAMAVSTTSGAKPVAADAAAAVTEKTPIYLQVETRDAIGAAYVARLREAFDKSRAFQPVTTPEQARFVVGILTMDPNEAESGTATGHATVAAVTLQRENASGLNQFVYSWVLVARGDKVDALATELVTAIDREIQDLDTPVIRFVD